MATVEVTQCDQCRAEIPKGRRRFAFSAHLHLINGHMSTAVESWDDICSEQCLHALVTTMTRDVEAMHVREGVD